MDEIVVRTEKLTKRFWKTTAVQNLDLEVPKGSIYALLGRNGAGKTTAIRMLLGMLRPTSGRSTVFELDSQKQDCAIKRRVGYVSEGTRLYSWMKIRDALWFTSRFYPTWSDERAGELLERFQLDPNAKIKTLSRGMHAQVCLILALAHEPDLFIFDEATAGLDVVVRRQFLEYIADLASEEGKTVLISSHLIHDVERIADRIAFIEQGALIYEGKQEDLKASYKQLRLTFADAIPEELIPGNGNATNAHADVSTIPIPGLVQARHSGREALLTVKGYSKQTEQACGEFLPDHLEVLDLTLEDIFATVVGGEQ
jgi:ABC-2 type transport system ATP-binding protein